jgi:hypothetical protein
MLQLKVQAQHLRCASIQRPARGLNGPSDLDRMPTALRYRAILSLLERTHLSNEVCRLSAALSLCNASSAATRTTVASDTAGAIYVCAHGAAHAETCIV